MAEHPEVSKNLRVGMRIWSGASSYSTLLERKSTDDGWWVTENQTLGWADKQLDMRLESGTCMVVDLKRDLERILAYTSVSAYSIARQMLERNFLDGIEAAINLYYDNYEDATELDPEFYKRLVDVADACTVYEEDVQEAIRDAEKSYNGDHANRNVHTALADEEEDENDEV